MFDSGQEVCILSVIGSWPMTAGAAKMPAAPTAEAAPAAAPVFRNERRAGAASVGAVPLSVSDFMPAPRYEIAKGACGGSAEREPMRDHDSCARRRCGEIYPSRIRDRKETTRRHGRAKL